MKPELIYIQDALCGWCYAFSPVFSRLKNEFEDRMNIEVLAGGMVLGDRVQPVSHMASYILGAIPRVEEFSGVEFGEAYKAILKEGNGVYGSEKPARALQVIKQLAPQHAVHFAHEIQKGFFTEGKSMEEDESYREVLKKLDIPEQNFFLKMADAHLKNATQEEFNFVKRLGISGFPTVIAKKENQYYLLAQGFRKYEDLQPVIEKFLA